ncbi:FAD-dependent urate hydroxylase [Dietzia timorensis]|uniref:FAD-dependent urate hydroxylase n=1 Tax=Dietzia timorensis TaxID=499555 RepID=A0A173LM56_9ACTN|nr:FAD-dependent urate hydroxylase [Dietzia timorensis]
MNAGAGAAWTTGSMRPLCLLRDERTTLTSTLERPVAVIVVGGSLAGLMAGIALARQGHDVTLLERAQRHRPSGAALSVSESALRRILGPDHARAAARMAGPRDGDARADVPSTWAGLYEGLCRAAESEPRINLLHGARATGIGQDGDRAWASTDDGRRFEAGVLVGADGHRSLVRSAVAPDKPDALFAGYGLWLGVASERDLDYGGRWPGRFDILDSGDHVLLGYPLASPDGSTEPGERRLGWAWYDGTRNALFRRLGAVRGTAAHHSLRAADLDAGVVRELEREAGRRWPRPWRDAILDSMRRSEFAGTPIAEYVPEKLANGRIVLVGDAAHVPTPMTGRGFATSLDDAEALARHLRDVVAAGGPAALEAYEAERLAPARSLVLGGQGFSRSFTRAA